MMLCDDPIWIKATAIELAASMSQPADPPAPWLKKIAKQIGEMLPPAPSRPRPSEEHARLLEVFETEYQRLTGEPISEHLRHGLLDLLGDEMGNGGWTGR